MSRIVLGSRQPRFFTSAVIHYWVMVTDQGIEKSFVLGVREGSVLSYLREQGVPEDCWAAQLITVEYGNQLRAEGYLTESEVITQSTPLELVR